MEIEQLLTWQHYDPEIEGFCCRYVTDIIVRTGGGMHSCVSFDVENTHGNVVNFVTYVYPTSEYFLA